MFERRLPFFGCGIGWCWFLVPLDLVRCSYSLLLQVLQPGSSRATRTCCFCCSGSHFYSSNYCYPFCFADNVYTETIEWLCLSKLTEMIAARHCCRSLLDEALTETLHRFFNYLPECIGKP
uniref:Uncharacterized protein n=1 Tax=Leersia perrieri TaxID=77586 RepID=A0A0D9WDG9_9ORYZ